MTKFRTISFSTAFGKNIVYKTARASASASATAYNYEEAKNIAENLSLELARNAMREELEISKSSIQSSIVPSEESVSNESSYTTNSTTEIAYPWMGGQINAYYFWQGNFVGSSPVTQYYFTSVSAQQTSSSGPSNLVSGSGTFTYNENNIPSGINSIFLFTGYSNAQTALNNLTNYTTGSNMYTVATDYLSSSGQTNTLIGLCLGGGSSTGEWDTGSSGAVYSVYQAVTQSGVSFSYTETGTGNTYSGTGTGTLNNSYNSLIFDLEIFNSSGEDFINLFNYIKKNSNSTFNSSGGPYECIIIVTISHSCSNNSGSGASAISTLLGDTTGSYDYISPQLYTQNVGTTNEYCANYQILWSGSNSFVSYLQNNLTYTDYGLNMILPSVNFLNLYNTGGSNDNNSPNLYFYQSSGNSVNPAQDLASGYITIDYNTDNGSVNFFNSIFGTSSSTIGGSVQWVNGTLS